MRKIFTTVLLVCSFIGFGQIDLSSDLLIDYQFNNNTLDESGHGYNLKPIGGIQLATNRFGEQSSAYDLSGVGTYLSSELIPDLSGDEITIAYWFKGTNVQSAVRQQDIQYIVAGWGKSPFGCNRHILSNSGGASCTLGVAVVENEADLYDDEWHFIVVVWKRNELNGFKSYFDGVVIDSTVSTNVALPKINAPLELGVFIKTEEETIGLIDDVKIYKRVLNNAEIGALFNYSPYAAPKVSNNSSCGNANFLIAEGKDIQWYNDSIKTTLAGSGDTLVVTETTEGDYPYWATQTINNLESDPVKAILTILPKVANATKPTTSVVSFCQGSKTTSTFSVVPIANASTYIWSINPSNAGIITGTTVNATVAWNKDFIGLATIKVKGTNESCGDGIESSALNVSVLESPDVEQNLARYFEDCNGKYIVLDAGEGLDSYLWNTGSTEQKIAVIAEFVGDGSHTYTVSGKKGECSTTESVTIEVKKMILARPSFVVRSTQIVVSPNPSNGLLTINFENVFNETSLTIELVDELGRSFWLKNVPVSTSDFKTNIDLGRLDKGVYLLKISGDTLSETQTIIIE